MKSAIELPVEPLEPVLARPEELDALDDELEEEELLLLELVTAAVLVVAAVLPVVADEELWVAVVLTTIPVLDEVVVAARADDEEELVTAAVEELELWVAADVPPPLVAPFELAAPLEVPPVDLADPDALFAEPLEPLDPEAALLDPEEDLELDLEPLERAPLLCPDDFPAAPDALRLPAELAARAELLPEDRPEDALPVLDIEAPPVELALAELLDAEPELPGTTVLPLLPVEPVDRVERVVAVLLPPEPMEALDPEAPVVAKLHSAGSESQLSAEPLLPFLAPDEQATSSVTPSAAAETFVMAMSLVPWGARAPLFRTTRVWVKDAVPAGVSLAGVGPEPPP